MRRVCVRSTIGARSRLPPARLASNQAQRPEAAPKSSGRPDPEARASWVAAAATFAVAVGGGYLLTSAEEPPVLVDVDYKAVEEDLIKLMDSAGSYDDGSYGPLFIRLAWHCAGNFSKHDKTGGTNGATMRFHPESAHGGNAGLHIARQLLEPIKAKYPDLSYADLYTLAGTVAIQHLGGPRPKWRPGRRDFYPDEVKATPDGRLPDGAKGADHLRDVFYRMGFSDQEIVALSGAHALGRCHRDRSGFEGKWAPNPTFLDNSYFRLLVDEPWTERKWNGPRQFQDRSGELMMLPSDIALTEDPAFSHWVHAYADDEDLWRNHFSAAWSKLIENNVEYKHKPVFKKLFG